MAGAGITHGQLAAKLIVEGCLANIAGNVQGQMPVAPLVLSELERADIGLKHPGNTLFFPLDESGVFFDLSGSKSSVWFTDADYDSALDQVERAIKAAFPRAKLLKEITHPSDPRTKVRSYEVDFGNSRLALVEMEFPAARDAAKRFAARITAQARRN